MKIKTKKQALQCCDELRGIIASLQPVVKDMISKGEEFEQYRQRAAALNRSLSQCQRNKDYRKMVDLAPEIGGFYRDESSFRKQAEPISARGLYLIRRFSVLTQALGKSDFADLLVEISKDTAELMPLVNRLNAAAWSAPK